MMRYCLLICLGDSKSSGSGIILKFKDEESTPDSFYEYPSSLRDGKVPLIIDNGMKFNSQINLTIYKLSCESTNTEYRT